MDHKDKSEQGEITQVLIEFLEVAINSIVFLKGIYPPGAFERHRYMNVAVQRARHPQLHEYIHFAVSSLRPFLQKGLVERVVVIFYNKDHVPAEKFVFKLSFNQSSNLGESTGLGFALRSFLVKLSVAEPVTRALPVDCRWEITAYFHSLPCVENDSKEAQMWVPTDTKHWQHPPIITPIKSMNSELMNLQLYLEHPQPTE
ncbi:DNA polymerase zeta processivity subunit [Nymphaea colorata]|nr:DNA polymerase zeta processivity subunit [Nymphaea colorata]XP_031504973.1 DNA polymerase zeta processivity subunit [Nymphaea colorata]